MVDTQSISIILAALSFVVAAIYYAMNLREVRRNRRITLTTTMLQQPFMTKEGFRQFLDLMAMEWSSLDDYKNKYDHIVNPENCALRQSLWNTCESIGLLYREGMLDLKTLSGGSTGMITLLWYKFEPIIKMYRGKDYAESAYENFEFVAKKLEEYLSLDEIINYPSLISSSG